MSARAAQPGMIEREHHAWGALLKYVEAVATVYRYDRYPKRSKTGKKIERFIAAAQKLREQLAHEYGDGAPDPQGRSRPQWPCRPVASIQESARRGCLLRGLQFYVFDEIENGPPDRVLKALGYDANERELYHAKVRELFGQKVNNLIAAAQEKLPWAAPPALPAPTPDRHDELRAALLENPDQPQAIFVERCRVHPNTVRRCRRELEAVGAIPFLAHRHAA